MSKELFDAVQMLAQEKGIPEDYLYEKISAAIVVAAKHDYNGKDIVHCDIDPEKQRFKVYVTKNVVEEVEDPDTDLTLEEAQAIKKSAKVGKTIDIPLKTKEFGRIIAQTAKGRAGARRRVGREQSDQDFCCGCKRWQQGPQDYDQPYPPGSGAPPV